MIQDKDNKERQFIDRTTKIIFTTYYFSRFYLCVYLYENKSVKILSHIKKNLSPIKKMLFYGKPL